MSAPKLGYLCLSENSTREAGRALIRQFVLVREAERMGYDDIWLAEHHFDEVWPQSAILALLGQLVAVTSKSRVGSLVLMPGQHDPLMLAEHVATLDLLSKGRLQLGVASGAAMSGLMQAQSLDRDSARARMHDHLTKVLGHLAGSTSTAGQTLVPLPAQQNVPVWLATSDTASIELAATEGWGLVAAATHTPERICRMVDTYLKASGGRAPELTLARFASTAATTAEAIDTAGPYFEALARHAAEAGWGQDPQACMARDPQAMLTESLVGNHAEVAAQFKAMAGRLGATRIAIVPTSGQFDTHKHILADFVDEVRPMLDED
jgi:alkanesulfonate monooxygenase SsuD/methylene tetrahydromethanopterin reductase-like flavin-dependent oxidoreductase (luciferase family)